MAPSLTPALASLLGALEPGTTIVLVAHAAVADHARALVADAGRAADAEIIPIDDAVPITIWAQDALLVGETAGASCLFVAPTADGALQSLYERIAAAAGLPLHRVADLPEGGNVVLGADSVFVGGDDWRDGALRQLFAPATRLVEVASRLPVPQQERRPFGPGSDWRAVLNRGNRPGTRQPIFHIDMFLAPAGRDEAGRERLLVGDPGLAAAVLGHAPLGEALQAHFDDIADGLAAAGFAVTRNPLPLVFCDRVEDRERDLYFASANNAMVQTSDDAGRIVWLPAYRNGNWPQLEATDAANAEIWRALGFEVRTITDCNPLAENFGGLNCMAKVLRREPDRAGAGRSQAVAPL